MASITLKGNTIHTLGELPNVGSMAPDFLLTRTNLSDITLRDFLGKKVILNIFPSLDTSVCATSVRKFNVEASKLENTVILGISRDLPFAHNRFCSAEGIDRVITASVLRSDHFARDYGVLITDGPMAGLLSRAVVVIDEKGMVIYTEQVPEITQEPDYARALSALN